MFRKLVVSLVSVVMIATIFPAPAAAATTSPSVGRWIGFYETGVPQSISPLADLESQVSTHAAVVNFFISDSDSFPSSRSQAIVDHGSIPLVTLQFSSTASGGLDPLIAGSKDAYLATFAGAAKAFGHEIWLRPFHEMNGRWAPWSGAAAGNTPAKLVQAWKHVHDIFAAQGATNVKFVWCPNDRNVPNDGVNTISAYWPGDAYVDYTAIDGYNWGTSTPDSAWSSFSTLFTSAYTEITGLTTKPLFLAEMASTETGGDKAAWITDMFSVIPAKFPRIQGIVWFDAWNENTFRVDSSAASLAAFKAGAATWTTTAPSAPAKTGKVKRVAGANRYATAVQISQSSFTSADSVLIATGLDYADALAAAPLAGALKAPVLLVPKSSVPDDVAQEIVRLGAKKAIVAGGETAVTDGVVRTLQSLGLSVERIAGAGRYATAAKLAERTAELTGKTSVDTVFITRGDSFADALGVSAVAYNRQLPVLLVRPGALPAETQQALQQLAPAHIVVIGSPLAISDGVAGAMASGGRGVTRVAGSNRYATSAAVAAYAIDKGWADAGFVGVAAGTVFPDALGGGAATGGHGGVLLLTAPATLPTETRSFLAGHAAEVSGVNLFGGTLAVQANVEADVASACE